jgi:hypothetical protein
MTAPWHNLYRILQLMLSCACMAPVQCLFPFCNDPPEVPCSIPAQPTLPSIIVIFSCLSWWAAKASKG